MRGKRATRQKHLEQAGWRIIEEHRESGRKHRLLLRRTWSARQFHYAHDPRGEEVVIEATTRPRAYLLAERTLVRKQGRDVQAVRP